MEYKEFHANAILQQMKIEYEGKKMIHQMTYANAQLAVKRELLAKIKRQTQSVTNSIAI